MATIGTLPIDIHIQRIRISEYIDATTHDSGYNPTPTKLDVVFTLGLVDDTITIKYMNPLDHKAIKEEIKRILNLYKLDEMQNI